MLSISLQATDELPQSQLELMPSIGLAWSRHNHDVLGLGNPIDFHFDTS